MKKQKFYACPHCGNFLTAASEATISCCGHLLSPLTASQTDETHRLIVEDDGDEQYITTKHPMTKEHYIQFIAYQMMDRMIIVRLYPEQDVHLYLPRMRKGKFYFLCSKDGLFEQ